MEGSSFPNHELDNPSIHLFLCFVEGSFEEMDIGLPVEDKLIDRFIE